MVGDYLNRVYFVVDPTLFTPLFGHVHDALTGATELRLFHSAALGYPPEPIVAQLGVDNITALASVPAVPEPASRSLLVAGVGLLALRHRRR